jgi:hypothetical protein
MSDEIRAGYGVAGDHGIITEGAFPLRLRMLRSPLSSFPEDSLPRPSQAASRCRY